MTKHENVDKRQPCNTCPFKESTNLEGAPDWLRDVLLLTNHHNHSCHKTDPKADGFTGAKVRRSCAGILKLGQPGFYKNKQDLAMAYINHWRKEGVIK